MIRTAGVFRIGFSLSISILLSACANYGQGRKVDVIPTNIDATTVTEGQESEEAEIAVPKKEQEAAAAVTEQSSEPPAEKDVPEKEDLLSLNFNEIGIRQLLDMLSDGGENFRYLLYPEAEGIRVRGLSLVDVSWREALEMVVKLHNLMMVEDDGLIIINTHENFVAEKEREAELARLQLIGKRSSRSFRLNYTQPDEVRDYLEKLFGITAGLTPGQQSSRSFARTKASLSNISFSTFPKVSIITAYGPPSQLEDVARRIAEIDVPQKQVFIETRIVDILRQYSRSLGVQWGGRLNQPINSFFPASVAVAGGAGSIGGTQNAVINFPATDQTKTGLTPAAVALALADAHGTIRLNMQLSALEQEGKSKTLSNPKIVTVNGVTAKVESGREIPYQTTSANLGTQTEFKKAVISLEVTPLITPDNMVNMKIVVKKQDADFTNQVLNVPSILTRVVETNVIVPDGGTAILGGVFENIKADTDTGTPFLSKIPIIGWLFKSNDKIDNEKEFLIFITPRIVKGDLSSTVVSRKFQ
jgi:type IV pilus assembly protein PilQ